MKHKNLITDVRYFFFITIDIFKICIYYQLIISVIHPKQ